MEDGPHTEGVNEAAPPTSKVVRLPRDWLGPHQELVPFGRRTPPSDALPTAPDAQPATPAADDFWGERSAAIHRVVEAPAYHDRPESAPAAERKRPRFIGIAFGPGRRRLAAAAMASVAVATAIVLLSAGSSHDGVEGERLNLAAILSSGISRSLTIGSPRIISTATGSRPHPQPRHVVHRASSVKAAPVITGRNIGPPPPAPTYATRATTVTVAPTSSSNVAVPDSHAATSPTPAGPSPSRGASVSATGQSGALGPVQSPNG